MKLTKKQREELKMKFGGNCSYCGCELGKTWHADHLEPCRRDIESYRKENGSYALRSVGHGKPETNVIDNFMPACAPCNISKSSYTLESWRNYLRDQIEYLNAYSKKYRMARAYGLVEETGVDVVFYFERFDQ